MIKVFWITLTLALTQSTVRADAYINQAKAFFGKYVKLENAFDPAIADLYSDSALIRNKRTYPMGNTRVLTLTGKQYKTLIRQVMPLAKARNDKNRYSRVTYKRIGKKVKISATRYSLLKQYSSPLTIIAVAAPKKKWLILEEHSESRP